MLYSVNSIYQSKVYEINSRMGGRLSEIDQSFKAHLDNAATALSAKESEKASLSNSKANTNSYISTNSYINTIPAGKWTYGETQFDDIIKEKSQKYSVGEDLIKAVIKAESSFNPNAVSKAGAQGLMQLMPATAAGLNVTNPFDPEQNIDGGVRYLKAQIDRFGGDVKLALAAYNCGPGRVSKLGLANLDDPAQMAKLPLETQNYIKRIYSFLN